MRPRSLARLVGALVFLATANSASAQGSWLPYGTLGASDIAVSPKGVVWLIGREPNSIRTTLVLSETRFFTPRGSPARVAVDLNGFPWLLNSDGTLWRYARNSAGKEDWEQLPLKAIDIAVGASGAVWAIDTDKKIVGLQNGAWKSIGGSGVKIAVDPTGNPWVVNPDGKVSHWTGSTWTEIAASATDISVSPEGTVFILGTTRVRGGFEVLRLNGSSWERLVGGAGVAISAGSQAVFVAQDTTTNLVLSSVNARLRAATDDPTSVTAPVASSATPGSTPSTTSAAAPGDAARNSAGTTPGARADQGGGSNPLPSAGSVAGAVGGAVGALGGLLSAGASVAGAVPVPVPPQGAIATAVGTAAAGAAAGAVTSAAGSVVSGTVGSMMPGAGSAAPAANAAQPQASNQAQSSPDKLNAPEKPAVSSPRPAPRVPLPGSLRCPIIGGGELMERGCELIGREAMKLRDAPSADCVAPSFADARNGGECWTCPAGYRRGTSVVDSPDACLGPEAQPAAATLVKGCSTFKPPPGYGTPFRDSPSGSECWVCPLPLQRSWSAVRSLTKGNLAACFGKAREMLVWQLGQYPEAGPYRFMPGLLSMALSDPKAVDLFLEKRANGDTTRKRQMWAAMIEDPASSAELKAMLFASLLKVAKEDSATAEAKEAVSEFESYIRARRVYVADEALRMYRKAREVDVLYQQAKDSAGRIASDAVSTAATDFKTYAWSAVLPDSAGSAFIAASTALSELGVSAGAAGVVDAAVSSLNAQYLQPVTSALTQELEKLEAKVADVASVGTTLLAGAVKISRGVLGFFDKDKVAAEYEKYVEEMGVPVKIRGMLESPYPEDRQTLLLYWALATSAHRASDKIGTGALTGTELCSSDSWTAEQCSSAKAMVLAAAKAAGYVN